LSYASAAPAIATVDANGVVRGVGLGQTTVTVTLTGASGTQAVLVQVAVSAAGLAISPTSASTPVNGTVRFTANPLDVNGAALPAVPVAWSVSDVSIGSLSAGSATAVDVRGLKIGTTTVRATLGTLSAGAQLTVTQPLPAARLEKVSGDGATCPTRSTTCTFVVRAVDVNGVPVAGATITWESNAACGPPQTFRTDAAGLSTANNICASVAPGAYTQTAALASIGVQVAFAYTLRGLVLTFQTVDNAGSYIYAVTSPSGTANGLSAKVDFTSGPIAGYVTKLGFSSTSTPATLTVGILQTQYPPGDYAFDIIVSTTTTSIGPGVATVTFTVSDSSFGLNERRSGRNRPASQASTRTWKAP